MTQKEDFLDMLKIVLAIAGGAFLISFSFGSGISLAFNIFAS
jgi:hypothetical protein